MKLIRSYVNQKGKKLQIMKGDLTDLPRRHASDALVISAFPNDYTPTPDSLIGALDKKGVFVSELAKDMELDLRTYSHCWISKPLSYPNIKRILCFEPENTDNPYTLIAGVFQSLSLVGNRFGLKTVALPMVLTGDRGQNQKDVSEELVKTALFWLNHASFDCIKLIEQSEEKTRWLADALAVAVKEIQIDEKKGKKKRMIHALRKNPSDGEADLINFDNTEQGKPVEFDFFISYSRKNEKELHLIQKLLEPHFHLFIDKQEIGTGTNWIRSLNAALKTSKRFIVCLSPDYIKSNVCQYEYSFCNLTYINKGDGYVLPVFLYSAELPFEMSVLNHFNAREGDPVKIEEFCKWLVKSFNN